MIIETAKALLEKLRRTNFKQVPDFGLDETSETIINVLSNECKSTIVDGEQVQRYGSDVVRNNIDAIVRQFIINGTHIPKETMNEIIQYKGRTIGINSDIDFYKGIGEDKNGNVKTIAALGRLTINVKDLDFKIQDKIQKDIYKGFSRQLFLSNLKAFPKQNSFLVFKEKLLHGRENRETLSKKFEKILRKNTNYDEEIIKNTVQYHLDYMYDEKFAQEVINSINQGASLIPIGEKNRNPEFLIYALSVETRRYNACITRYKSNK